MTWHARNSFPQEDIERGKKVAKTQDEKILEFFRANPVSEFTPLEVWGRLIFDGIIHEMTPITSIRRSITNLTVAGYLEKLETAKKERYGMSNRKWRLLVKEKQLQFAI